jgi:hypothetical protein
MVQERPNGWLKLRAMVELKPPVGVIVMVDAPEIPGFRLTTDGFAAIEKFAVALVTITVRVGEFLVLPGAVA